MTPEDIILIGLPLTVFSLIALLILKSKLIAGDLYAKEHICEAWEIISHRGFQKQKVSDFIYSTLEPDGLLITGLNKGDVKILYWCLSKKGRYPIKEQLGIQILGCTEVFLITISDGIARGFERNQQFYIECMLGRVRFALGISRL